MTLTEFLLARIAEDEERVREGTALVNQVRASLNRVRQSVWSQDELPTPLASDRRQMRECEFKRALVEWDRVFMEHAPDDVATSTPSLLEYFSLPLRNLAVVYSDHEDFDWAWVA